MPKLGGAKPNAQCAASLKVCHDCHNCINLTMLQKKEVLLLLLKKLKIK